MEVNGTIVAAAESPPLDRDRWRALCKSHPNLEAYPSVFKRNPFKPGETMELRAPSDSVRIMISGCESGSMSWATDESPMIMVSGVDPAIVRVVEQIAEALSAVFVQESNNLSDGDFSSSQ